MDEGLITAISALIVAVLAGLGSLYVKVKGVQKDEIILLHDSLRMLQEENKRLCMRVEELENDKQKSDHRIDDLECEIEQIRESRTKTIEENQKLRDRVQNLEDENTRKDECNEKLESEMRAMRQEFERKIAKLANQVIRLGGKPETGDLLK